MININLTNEYKQLLVESKLVKTGKLKNSIKVHIIEKGNDIIINIISLPYLSYLIDKYNLTNRFTTSDIFINEISNIIYNKAIDSIDNIIEENKTTNIDNINISITYNNI